MGRQQSWRELELIPCTMVQGKRKVEDNGNESLDLIVEYGDKTVETVISRIQMMVHSAK